MRLSNEILCATTRSQYSNISLNFFNAVLIDIPFYLIASLVIPWIFIESSGIVIFSGNLITLS